MKRSLPKTYDGSTFRGNRVAIKTQDEVVPALHAVYRDHRAARATHNSYAYRIQTATQTIEHYEDDGETGAGARILEHLRKRDATNVMTCVTRWYGGRNLGPERFNYVEEAAKDCMDT